MKQDKLKVNISPEVLTELPLMFLKSAQRDKDTIEPIKVRKSSFYNSDSLLCHPSSKPISKILP